MKKRYQFHSLFSLAALNSSARDTTPLLAPFLNSIYHGSFLQPPESHYRFYSPVNSVGNENDSDDDEVRLCFVMSRRDTANVQLFICCVVYVFTGVIALLPLIRYQSRGYTAIVLGRTFPIASHLLVVELIGFVQDCSSKKSLSRFRSAEFASEKISFLSFKAAQHVDDRKTLFQF